MSLPTMSEVLDATEHLPEGALLVIPQSNWDDYERLLEALAEDSHLRVTYDGGTLEIMSPRSGHEKYARLIDALVDAFCDASGLTVESYGCTTWKKRVLAKGAEGDGCYYVRNTDHIINKENIDLDSDPPPDIVVEIDTTGNSLRKLAIYAALGISEVWRYDERKLQIYELKDGAYIEHPSSKALPNLTGTVLTEFIQLSKAVGRTKARHAFSQRLAELKRTPDGSA